jgi:hypothetical protein
MQFITWDACCGTRSNICGLTSLPYHTPLKNGRSFVSLEAFDQIVQFICWHLVQAVIFCEVVLWQPLRCIPHVGCIEVQVILPIVEYLLQQTNNNCWMNHTNVLDSVNCLGLLKTWRFGEWICFHLQVGRTDGVTTSSVQLLLFLTGRTKQDPYRCSPA